MTGNDGGNILDGGFGNDILNGGMEAGLLIGGLGFEWDGVCTRLLNVSTLRKSKSKRLERVE